MVGSQFTYSMYGNQKEEEKEDWFTCPHITGMILIIWFGVIGGLTYIVPCARYHASGDPPIGEKMKVNDKFDALHWLTTLGPIMAGVGACFDGSPRLHKRWVWTLCTIGGVLWLSCYMGYVIVFFLSSEWKQTYEVISFDEWQKLNDQWINAPAEVWVYGTAIRHSSKGMPGDCETSTPVVVKTGGTEDFSEPLKLTREQIKGKAIRLRTIVNVKRNSTGDKVIREVEKGVKDCLEQNELLSDYGTRTIGAVTGFKPYLMVTENGKKPQSLWRGAAGTGGFFAAGIVYLYDLARVSPVVTYEMTKECNITEVPPNMCDQLGFCSIL